MLIIDANAILRYVLYDNENMANEVNDLILNKKITVRYEVMAEVVYVLEKVYAMSRNEIAGGIKVFLGLPNIETETVGVLQLALETYASVKMDFVDCLLYGFYSVCGHDIFTFDKKLKSVIERAV